MRRPQVKMLTVFQAGEIELTSHNGEQVHTTRAPLETTEWAARLQSRRQFRSGCLAGEPTVRYRTVRPELGPKVVDVVSVLVGREVLELQGVETPVTVRARERPERRGAPARRARARSIRGAEAVHACRRATARRCGT
jgi:hypothetical protein